MTRTLLTVALIVLFLAAALSASVAGSTVDRVHGLQLSPDGRFIGVWSDRGVAIADTSTARRLLWVPAGRRMAFAPDADVVAVSTPDSVTVARLPQGDMIDQFDVHSFAGASLAFTPDGTGLAAVEDETGHLTLRDVAARATLWRIAASAEPHTSVAVSDDGALVATGGVVAAVRSSTARLWDRASGAPLDSVDLRRYAYVERLDFRDGALVVHHSDGLADQRMPVGGTPPRLGAPTHEGGPSSGNAEWSNDGRRAVVPVSSGRPWELVLEIVDADTGAAISRISGIDGAWWSACFAADGSSVMIATDTGRISTFDVKTGALLGMVEGFAPAGGDWTWYVLAGAAIAWLTAWIVLVARRPRPIGSRPSTHDPSLVVAACAATAAFIVLLHWLQVAVPFPVPDPISFLGLLALLELACFIGLGVAAAVTRSWLAMVATAAGLVASLAATILLLGEAIAAV